jgi:GTP-binding protein
MLDKLSTEEGVELDEDIIAELDEATVRLKKVRKSKTEDLLVRDGGGIGQKLALENTQARYRLQEKLDSVSGRRGSSLGVYNLLLEMRDKDTVYPDLAIQGGEALARLDSAKLALNGYRLLQKWQLDSIVSYPSGFFESFVNNCCSRFHLAETGLKLAQELEDTKVVKVGRFECGRLCVALHRLEKNVMNKANEESQFVQLLNDMLAPGHLDESTITDVNMVIRVLGTYHRVTDIFNIIDHLRTSSRETKNIEPNDETLEFLSNAVVNSVGKQGKAQAMKDLPVPCDNIPEVVFTGRSNVGKSSLVNMLCNRKALASTSATPGHTKQFHFFRVNEGLSNHGLPDFYLVDVPGLGYAEVDEGRQTSWRSLLERYLTVRSSLGVVFHLIDSRHGLTKTDAIQLNMTLRAITERKESGELGPMFQYCIVLTKTDKAGVKAVRKTREEVVKGTSAVAAALSQEAEGLRIIETSSVARKGREEILRLLYEDIKQRQL